MEVMSMFKIQDEQRNVIVDIPIENIKPNPYQPRRRFEITSLRELANSIKQYGLIQPVSVRKTPQGDYELIAGERRLRASVMAGLSKIPSVVIEMNEDDTAIVALIENLQRQDLSFMEEAQAYHLIMVEHGYTQEQLAYKVGKTQSTIANKLRLLKLPPSVKKIINDKRLTERHARALLRLPDEQSQLGVLKKICDYSMNVKESEDLIEKTIKPFVDDIMDKSEVSPKQVRVLKDVRIFLNTINHAVSVMRDSGIDAVSTHNEFGGYHEYIIKIPKKI